MSHYDIDLHCNGCGEYCHSIYPDADIPEEVYCKSCDDHVSKKEKSGVMLNHEWYRASEVKRRSYQDKLEEQDQQKLGSFLWTSYNHGPLPRTRKGLEKLTDDEWTKLSISKLNYYKQYCDNKSEYDELKKFIDEAK